MRAIECLYKQTQSADARGDGHGPGPSLGHVALNKPSFRLQIADRGQNCAGMPPWDLPAQGPVVQTNPIPGAVPIGRSVFPGPDVRSEANHRQDADATGAPNAHPVALENSLASKAPRG
jgi:hypothetical protein